MSTAPVPVGQGRRFELSAFRSKEVWGSIAITAIWLAVLFTSLFGPDIVTMNGGPAGNVSRVPSGVAVAFFATISTFFLVRHGFRDPKD